MATQQQDQCLRDITNNDNGTPNTGDVSFPLFPSFPVEIRLLIWNFALIERGSGRMLVVDLHNNQDFDPKCTITSPPGSPDCHYYTAIVQAPHQIYSKFLRVTRESRDAALGFYRIKVPNVLIFPNEDIQDEKNGNVHDVVDLPSPVKIRGGFGPSHNNRRTKRAVRTTLHLNPDHDYLRLVSCMHKPFRSLPATETGYHALLDFLHHLQALQPRQKLGLNLVMDSWEMRFLKDQLVDANSDNLGPVADTPDSDGDDSGVDVSNDKANNACVAFRAAAKENGRETVAYTFMDFLTGGGLRELVWILYHPLRMCERSALASMVGRLPCRVVTPFSSVSAAAVGLSGRSTEAINSWVRDVDKEGNIRAWAAIADNSAENLWKLYDARADFRRLLTEWGANESCTAALRESVLVDYVPERN